MHTFDGALLKLDGMIDKADGTKLKIVKPGASSSAPPFDVIAAKAVLVAGEESVEATAKTPDAAMALSKREPPTAPEAAGVEATAALAGADSSSKATRITKPTSVTQEMRSVEDDEGEKGP